MTERDSATATAAADTILTILEDLLSSEPGLASSDVHVLPWGNLLGRDDVVRLFAEASKPLCCIATVYPPHLVLGYWPVSRAPLGAGMPRLTQGSRREHLEEVKRRRGYGAPGDRVAVALHDRHLQIDWSLVEVLIEDYDLAPFISYALSPAAPPGCVAQLTYRRSSGRTFLHGAESAI